MGECFAVNKKISNKRLRVIESDELSIKSDMNNSFISVMF